ncbi:uncharacterized protein CTRU02_207719 [Colletotrichum truncatum]|uniref:Uncharacterized protein n=1 Tax=Colletotrichum truncatum TaxID=5467 RepID=A0ACC3Z1K9_COLTU|nr:uncharacterized protein CTRU02_09176 [Colletotrichum truncatum]KAF6788855.1 hypothetical protein CTRU02_09176 [Colletotrichum truncatum]
MYRSATSLLGLSRAAAMRPQTFARVAFPTTAKRIAPATTTRGYAARASAADVRSSQRMNKAMADLGAKGFSAKEMEKAQSVMHILLPGTFVPLPFSQLSKSPSVLLSYYFNRFKQHARDLATFVGLKFQSMPSFMKRPRVKFHRTQIVPTAKALHRQLAEALASGDKDALRELCTPRLYETLSATISRRKASEKLTWELVRYHGSPSVMSHRVALLPPVGKAPLVQQAVVAITSTQKLGKVEKATGNPIKGSTRVQKQTEYFVITRQLDPNTYEPKKWLVWGNTQATTPEDWEMEQKTMTHMEQQDFAKRRGKRV